MLMLQKLLKNRIMINGWMAAEDISPVSIRAVKRGKYYRRLYNGTESDRSSSNDQKATKIIWRWPFFTKGNAYEKDYFISAHFSYGTCDRRLRVP